VKNEGITGQGDAQILTGGQAQRHVHYNTNQVDQGTGGDVDSNEREEQSDDDEKLYNYNTSY